MKALALVSLGASLLVHAAGAGAVIVLADHMGAPAPRMDVAVENIAVPSVSAQAASEAARAAPARDAAQAAAAPRAAATARSERAGVEAVRPAAQAERARAEAPATAPIAGEVEPASAAASAGQAEQAARAAARTERPFPAASPAVPGAAAATESSARPAASAAVAGTQAARVGAAEEAAAQGAPSAEKAASAGLRQAEQEAAPTAAPATAAVPPAAIAPGVPAALGAGTVGPAASAVPAAASAPAASGQQAPRPVAQGQATAAAQPATSPRAGVTVAAAPSPRPTISPIEAAGPPEQAVPQRVAPAASAPPSPVPVPDGGTDMGKPPEEVAMLAPDRPEAAGGTSAPADPLGRLSAFIGGVQAGPCFLALGSDKGGGLTLRQFSAETARLDLFGRSAKEAFPDIATVSQAIGAAQCGALGFARTLPRYPEFRLNLEMEKALVPRGGRLRGRVTGPGAAAAYLLLVDDEGQVQLPPERYLAREDGAAGFSVPMVLTGPPKSPTQLLVALSRPPGGLDAVENMKPAAAEAFFRRLGEEAARRGLDLDFAIAGFSLAGKE